MNGDHLCSQKRLPYISIKKENGQNTKNCLLEYKSLYSVDLFKYLLKFYQVFIKNDISLMI